MYKRLVLLMMAVFAVSAWGDTRPKPPVPNMQEMNQYKGNCKVPEFLVNIPPMMENDYTECVNDRNKPSKALVDVVLKQQVDQKAEFVSIVPAPRFYTRVYKVTYKIGGKTKAMICNDKMTYCLDDKPIVSRER
jgi:hypothetical protein